MIHGAAHWQPMVNGYSSLVPPFHMRLYSELHEFPTETGLAELERLGVAVRSPYSETNIPQDADIVVIGNALSRGNPEVEAVLDAKRRHTSQAALLADEFLRDLVPPGVSQLYFFARVGRLELRRRCQFQDHTS